MLTIEELLTPRWKVIADYPQSLFFINEIVHYDGFWARTKEVKIGINPNDYPLIFKKLEWWEEREEKDLPKFLEYEKQLTTN